MKTSYIIAAIDLTNGKIIHEQYVSKFMSCNSYTWRQQNKERTNVEFTLTANDNSERIVLFNHAHDRVDIIRQRPELN